MEFVEYIKKSSDKTSVWHYFLRSINGQQAKCKRCHTALKISGSTSTLHNHLLRKHSMNIKKEQDVAVSVQSEHTSVASSSKSEDPPSKIQKLTDFFVSQDSLANIITRMAVLDGIPLKVFCTSTDLRKLLQKNCKENIPKSPNSIRKIVMDVYNREKSTLIAEIKDLKSKGVKFSTTFDEWTSVKSHRYLNLNIHYQNDAGVNSSECLGLIRILGSMGAEACVTLVEIRLNSFELCLYKDIIGLTTDGAAVMMKVGRIIPVPYHQLCLAHGVQLAVLDVLYKKQVTSQVEEESSSDSDSETDEDIVEGFSIENTRLHGQLNDDYQKIIKKVRTLVKTFKNSPTKNDMLQIYVQAEFGKQLGLLLDCKTRWNSLATMLERFLKLNSSVQKALIDIKSNIAFSDIEMMCLQNLQTCLDMIKTTVEVLCRRDATILTADTALQFLVTSLENQNTLTGQNLAISLRRRIKERRLHAVVGALQYLNNPNQFLTIETQENEGTFIKPSYEDIKNVICQAAAMDDAAGSSPNLLDSSSETVCESDLNLPSLNFKEQLDRKLSIVKTNSADTLQQQPASSSSRADLPAIIHVEMALFENGGGCGEILKNVLKRLLAIPPTSVESERAFSTAGIFCNKLRSRLNDDTLNSFMFLRYRLMKK